VGLVEVVQVDHEVTLGRGVEAEVAQVGVAADDRRDPGGRQVRHVLGHDDGGAAQEPVRRVDHPPDPHRDQPLHPADVALLDQVDRVGAVGRRAPLAERRARHALSQRLAEGVALGTLDGTLAQRRVGRAVGVGEDGVATHRCLSRACHAVMLRPGAR
jgi:hypothetical protein